MTLEIRTDDLSSPAVRALVAAHLDAMHAQTPAESVHALGLSELQDAAVTVWTAWRDGDLAGVGALKRMDAARGEVKSMRVAPPHLGTGVGRALLRHIMAASRERGLTSLWLETGSGAEFAAARGLYLSEGFTTCAPFADYTDDPLSSYFTRALVEPPATGGDAAETGTRARSDR